MSGSSGSLGNDECFIVRMSLEYKSCVVSFIRTSGLFYFEDKSSWKYVCIWWSVFMINVFKGSSLRYSLYFVSDRSLLIFWIVFWIWLQRYFCEKLCFPARGICIVLLYFLYLVLSRDHLWWVQFVVQMICRIVCHLWSLWLKWSCVPLLWLLTGHPNTRCSALYSYFILRFIG